MNIMITLITMAFFLAASTQASEWEASVISNVTKANAANCASYPAVSSLDEQFLCESLLLNITNSIYENWLNEVIVDNKIQAIDNWWNIKTASSLNNPLVKLHLAALGGQIKGSETAKYRKYVLKYLLSENELIQGAAITAIGWVGNCSDETAIVDIIKNGQEGLAEKAVLALIKLVGYSKSAEVLGEIDGVMTREGLRKFVKNQFASF